MAKYKSIAEQVQEQFQASRQQAYSEAQMQAMRQQIEAEQYGIGDFAWDAITTVGGGALDALDAPRRGLQALGWAMSGRDWADAWELAESGSNIMTEGLGIEAPEDSWGSWGVGLLGFATDVVTDPLMYFGIGALTKAGKAAKKAGKLGLTWAQQAAKGQRAALTLWTPWKTMTVLDSPAFVRAEALLGQKVAKAPIVKSLVRAFSTKSMDPRVNRLVDDIMAKSAMGNFDILKWRDKSLAFMDQLSPEDYLDVIRLAEATGTRGQHAQQIIRASRNWSPKKQAFGKGYHDVIQAFERVTGQHGIAPESLGGAIRKKVRVLGAMENKEWKALEAARKAGILKYDNQINAALSQAEAASRSAGQLKKISVDLHHQGIDAVLQADREAARAATASAYVKKRAGVEKLFQDPILQAEDISTARTAAAKSKRLKDSVQTFYDRSARVNAQASATEAKAIAARAQAAELMEKKAVAAAKPLAPGQKLIEIAAEKSKFVQAQDNLPNYIPRHLTDSARKHLRKIGLMFADDGKKVWIDRIRGRHGRKMAEILIDGNKKEYLRPWHVGEMVEALKAPAAGGRLEKWSDGILAERGGLFGMIDNLLGRPKGIERMYNFDPVDNINRLADQAVKALRGKEMWRQLQNTPELFSKNALEGWFHVKDISKAAQEVLGDAWVSPEMFEELRRVYTNLSNPETRSILGKSWQAFTKAWKWSVTRVFPAYHARNHIEDTVRMLYNGPFDPVAVQKYMTQGIFKKGKLKLGELGERSADEAWRLAEAYGVVGSGEVAVGSIRRGDGTLRAIGRGADRLFQAPEDGRRFGYWVERLNRGFSPYQAKQEVVRTLFDYGDLSQFERSVASQIIPFYTYMKNTIRLHAQTALQQPGFLMAQQRAVERLRGEHQPEDVPEWARSRLFISLGPNERTGDERLLSAYGLPIQDIAEMLDTSGGFKGWFKQLAWRFHPIVRFPFRIGAATMAERPGYAPKVFKHLPDNLKEMMGMREQKTKAGEEYITIDPVYSVLLDTVGSRFYSTAKSLGRTDTDAARSSLRHLLGLNVVDYDPKEEKRRQARREFDDILARAKRRGDVAGVPAFYKPRNSQLSERDFAFLRAQQKALRK